MAVVAKCDVAEVIIHNESAAGVQEGGRTGQWSQQQVAKPMRNVLQYVGMDQYLYHF